MATSLLFSALDFTPAPFLTDSGYSGADNNKLCNTIQNRNNCQIAKQAENRNAFESRNNKQTMKLERFIEQDRGENSTATRNLTH